MSGILGGYDSLASPPESFSGTHKKQAVVSVKAFYVENLSV